jgi:hypothetical protein
MGLSYLLFRLVYLFDTQNLHHVRLTEFDQNFVGKTRRDLIFPSSYPQLSGVLTDSSEELDVVDVDFVKVFKEFRGIDRSDFPTSLSVFIVRASGIFRLARDCSCYTARVVNCRISALIFSVVVLSAFLTGVVRIFRGRPVFPNIFSFREFINRLDNSTFSALLFTVYDSVR